MACPNKYQKSSLRAYNSAEQSFSSPGNIKFATTTYKSGVSINLTEGTDTIYLRNSGLYYVTLDVIMGNGTAATDTAVQMYANGVAVPGALTEATIVATTDFEPGTISAVVPVTNCCPCNPGTPITFGVTGTTATIEGANVNVIKLA